MKTLISLIPFLAFTLTLSISHNSLTQAATVDCSPLFLKLADCLDYVSEGSTVDKPAASCCNGLKDVLKASPDCLCVGFRSSAQFGVKLNLTKALALPTACHLSAPPTNCAIAPAPQVVPPASAPGSTSVPAPDVNGPSASGNVVAVVPASPPHKSGSAGCYTVSLVAAAVGLVVASFF